jgi:choline dehydrogenase-like flavoprotein
MAILSQSHDGRPACQHCGYCMMHGCEFDAKSSTLATMIPRALATGNCELRAECTVLRVETNEQGRATGVVYVDGGGAEHRQRARAVIVAANGAETTRLLLLSETSRFPDGLANSSGTLGKYLMFNGQTAAFGQFDEPLNEYKSVQVTRILWDFYESQAERGFYGGGGMDARMSQGPLLFALGGLPPDMPGWGADFVRNLHAMYNHTFELAGHTTSLPVETNRIDLDPTHTDALGRPALRITYRDHDDDLATMQFMLDRSQEILEAAGATRIWNFPAGPTQVAAHLLGTARMGTDPNNSVVNPDHRTHDVPNLFICDGSSMVTSGRGQPTMTIQALAFRAADRITALAGSGELG